MKSYATLNANDLAFKKCLCVLMKFLMMWITGQVFNVKL